MKKIILILILMIKGFSMNSIYIWSSTFNNINNTKLVEFLNKHHINIALISASEKTDFYKLERFLKNDIKTEFLIGNNSWIYPEKRDKIDEKLSFLKNFAIYYLHLDIEPHTISVLKKDKKRYLNMYIEMLKYIKNKYPQYTLDISIPTFYPIEYVKIISQYVNKIYLMAYEYKNLIQLLKKIKKYDSIKEQIVIVFNCKDFDEIKLKNDILFIKKHGYKNIAFHSLKTLKEIYETK